MVKPRVYKQPRPTRIRPCRIERVDEPTGRGDQHTSEGSEKNE
jgi:hypothetical protein